MRFPKLKLPLRTTLLYLLFGSLWILLSDQILSIFVLHNPQQAVYQTLKGWFFILVSGFLLYILLLTELTGRKQSEDALRESEERFSKAFYQSPIGTILIDLTDNTIQEVNDTVLEIMGLPREQIIGQNDRKLGLQIEPEVYTGISRELSEHGMFRNKEVQVRLPNGEIRQVLNSGALITIQGKPYNLALLQDVTEHKQAEKALRASEERYRLIAQNAEDMIWTMNLEFQLTYVSPSVERALGYSAEEILASTPEQFLTPVSYAVGLNVFNEEIENAQPQSDPNYARLLELEYRRKNGSTFWVEMKFSLFRDSNGQPTGVLGVGRDITERKRAQDALRESEARLNFALEKSRLGEWDLNLDDHTSHRSLAHDRIFGYEALLSQWTYEMFLEHVIPDDRAEVDRRFQEAITTQTDWNFECRIHRTDGNVRWIWATGGHHFDGAGQARRMVGIVQDITERKRAEEALRENEERLRLSLQAANQGLYDLNVQTGAAIVNREYSQMLGYDPETFVETNAAWIERLHPDDRESVANAYSDYISGLLPEYKVEFRQKMQGGNWKWILSLGKVIEYDAEGKPLRMMGTHTDITQRKQAEENLNISETLYRRLFESAKDGILILDAETGMIVDVNPFLITLLGYSKEAFLGKNIWELGFFTDILANKANFLELQQKEYIRYEDLPLETAQGRRINVEFISNVYQTNHQKVIQCNIRDITERRQAEEQIQRQLKRLSALRMIDIAISSSFDLDIILEVVLQQVLAQLQVDASAILLFNSQMQTIEYTASRGFRSDALQHTSLKLGDGYASQAVLSRKTIHISALMETGSKLARALQLANEEFVDYYGVPLVSKGEVKGVLEIYHRSYLKPDAEWLEFLEALAGQAAIAIDNAQLFENLQRSNLDLEVRVVERTAELNRTNTELEHANRIKDEFLANMSHELRTPLTSILGLSESLQEQRRGSLNDHQEKSLAIIESSGRHLLELINDILDLSKIEAGKFDYYPQPISVDDICRSSLAFVKSQATKKSITITYLQDNFISKIFADPRRLKQILVNLLSNAVKFTLEHGEVILQVNADLEKDSIKLSVIDNGIGIATHDLRRLFQPFVQVDSGLNRLHEGTGLGLALVQKLTDLHGGSVQVESEVGKGSRFTVNLPCLQEEVMKLEKHESQPMPPIRERDENTEVSLEAPAHLGVILLADDNMPSILTIGEYVESHGYEVFAAHDGSEALKQAEAIHPDLILMDIQMPVMNGLEAIARLRGNVRFADTPIIALTALAMPGDRERSLLAGANEYMSKPVSLKQLVGTIKELLGKQK